MKANIHRVAIVAALVMALWHTMWSVLVWIGWAQPFIDFIFNIHFINPPYTVLPFKFMTALMLVGITFSIGYIFGLIGATLWNMLHEERKA